MFLDALIGLVDPRHTHFNKRCTSISEHSSITGRLVVHFQDGSTHEADVVLGADGIKSAVRDFVLGGGGATVGGAGEKHVAFSNTAAYRGLIPSALLNAAGFKMQLTDRPACFVGPDKVRGGSTRTCAETDVYRISRSMSLWCPSGMVNSYAHMTFPLSFAWLLTSPLPHIDQRRRVLCEIRYSHRLEGPSREYTVGRRDLS